jgi:predicted nucleic acid-binding protein
VSAFAWGEFLCGPLGNSDEADARRIAYRHVPVGTEEATRAARLFNRTGRRRGSFPDCIIAATAIVSGAELATSNLSDFERFREAGLEIAE